MLNKLDSIQALRALAAILVVFCHVGGHLEGFKEKYTIDDAWFNLMGLPPIGASGVDVFFIISGFIMALVTVSAHKHDGASKRFLVKRIFRIFPPYWLWTLILLSLLLFLPQLFSVRTFDLEEAILSLFLIPYNPSGANTSPVLAVGWTLSYEMYFYLLVSIGLFFSRRRFICGLGAFFLVSTVLGHQITHSSPIIGLVTNSLLWEFYFGFLLFEIWHCRYRFLLPASSGMALLLFLTMQIFWPESSALRVINYGLPAFVLVSGVLAVTREYVANIPKWMVFLGDSSYTLYLSHIVTMPAIAKLAVVLGVHKSLPPDVQIILYTVLAVMVGGVLYLITEKPLMNIRNKCVS